jgi:hypothetical protein
LLAAFDESVLRGLLTWMLVAGFIALNVRGATVAVRVWLAVLLAGATMNGLVMVLNTGMPVSPSPDTVLPYPADVIPELRWCR